MPLFLPLLTRGVAPNCKATPIASDGGGPIVGHLMSGDVNFPDAR